MVKNWEPNEINIKACNPGIPVISPIFWYRSPGIKIVEAPGYRF
jgi:hypothetical protein